MAETWEQMMERLAGGKAEGPGPAGPVGPDGKPIPMPPTSPVPAPTATTDEPPTRMEEPKGLTVGNLMDAYGQGLIDEATLKKRLSDMGYDDNDVGILMSLGAKGNADPELSLGQLFNAVERGVLNTDQVTERLREAGYSDDDINVLIKTNQPRPQDGPNISEEELWNQYDIGGLAGDGLQAELLKRGYTQEEVSAKFRYHKKPVEEKPEPKQVAKPQVRLGGDVHYGPASGGGTRPQARQVMNDFRTNFATALKQQSKSISLPAKQWAMDNMDVFLNDYLAASGGQEGAAFTLGANQIQTMFEGSKGMAGASRRVSAGPSQARTI